jgi:putative ABC transport system permease protein
MVGIAGCTGLLLTGFGLKDSISNILNYQYDEICKYDTIVGLSDNEVSDSAKAALDKDFSGWLLIELHSADIYTGDGDKSLSGYLYLPEEEGKLKSFITLQDRVSKKDVPFGSGSVVITEKLAKTFNIGVGGEIALKNDDGKLVKFTVTGVTENYVYHYVYIAPSLYTEKMGKSPEYNAVVAKFLTDDKSARSGVSDELLKADGVSTVTFTEDLRDKFASMITTLNYIVLVLIFSAGALAFVVLYNLTNINVTERLREIATIKVLGFYDREVSAYIYRETSILTVIGCVLGLGLGVLMHAFVIETVEVDNIMFGRSISFMSFVWSALLTLTFSVIVDIVMFRKLKKIGMADNLKSVD